MSVCLIKINRFRLYFLSKSNNCRSEKPPLGKVQFVQDMNPLALGMDSMVHALSDDDNYSMFSRMCGGGGHYPSLCFENPSAYKNVPDALTGCFMQIH